MKQMHLLRTKFSFLGASRFDSRSDRWVRVTFFQCALLVDELNAEPIDLATFDDRSSLLAPPQNPSKTSEVQKQREEREETEPNNDIIVIMANHVNLLPTMRSDYHYDLLAKHEESDLAAMRKRAIDNGIVVEPALWERLKVLAKKPRGGTECVTAWSRPCVSKTIHATIAAPLMCQHPVVRHQRLPDTPRGVASCGL